ncbi:hypothetical protein AB6A40_005786 [Gnathostoma spinigerum]|uniref:Molybdopterin synthase catalytic subunit n=1 Tax=Gnathostoma spinigerum TaxID=75299 RepID=A0ABD6EIN2_9BILA
MSINDVQFDKIVAEDFKSPKCGEAFVIGICGCTNAGKTTLAVNLVEAIKQQRFKVTTINQDDFYFDRDQLKRVPSKTDPEILFIHCDCAESLDEKTFHSSILRAANDFDVVIVEGNMIIELRSVFALLQRILFITLDKKTCYERRLKRDYDPPDLEGYFDQIVWPMYEKFYENAKKLTKANNNHLTFVDASLIRLPADQLIEKLVLCLSKDLVRIQTKAIDANEAIEFVTEPSDGAVSLFLGTTRNNFNEKTVVHLEYEAYGSMAYREMRKICQSVRMQFPQMDRIAMIHRVGVVPIGEVSVLIAASSPHRTEAIRATEFAIDELKRTVPIWKKEVYGDDTSSWKSNAECGRSLADLGDIAGNRCSEASCS